MLRGVVFGSRPAFAKINQVRFPVRNTKPQAANSWMASRTKSALLEYIDKYWALTKAALLFACISEMHHYKSSHYCSRTSRTKYLHQTPDYVESHIVASYNADLLYTLNRKTIRMNGPTLRTDTGFKSYSQVTIIDDYVWYPQSDQGTILTSMKSRHH